MLYILMIIVFDIEVNKMKYNIIGISICTLLILLPATVCAGSRNDPEITDDTGDARAYLDIEKAWFYENQTTPDFLYTTIELAKPNIIPPKQHLVVSWMMNGEYYASMLAIGYDIGYWFDFCSIIGKGTFGDPEPQIATITGDINLDEGTITCKIPKSTIGNPQAGDILTHTYSTCFQRFRFWGRLGFSPLLRLLIFDALGNWQVEDIAPNPILEQEYGKEYIIQY